MKLTAQDIDTLAGMLNSKELRLEVNERDLLAKLHAAGHAEADGFAPGDVVQLKSGGPRMTAGETKDGMIACAWHKADGTLERMAFMVEMLRRDERLVPVVDTATNTARPYPENTWQADLERMRARRLTEHE